MLGVLISIIVLCVIFGVIWWAVQELFGAVPIAEPFRTIIRVLMVLYAAFVVLYVLKQILMAAGVNVPILAHLG